MKNFKRVFTSLMFMLAVVVGSFASVNFNKTTTASANSEPVAIENGRTINAAIKGFIDSGAEFTGILHADETLFADYASATYKASMTDMFEQVLHLWVSEDSLYYYTVTEIEPDVCYLPDDSSLMFSYLTTVEVIDLTGFDSAMANTTSNMFEGCTALKEVTFNSSTVSLYDELTTLWTGDIYNKDTGDKISGSLNIDDGTLTVTNAVNAEPEEPTAVCKFDLRNGNGLVSPDGEFNYNPTSKYSFYGWSTELDGTTIVDKTQGNDASNYDSGDFTGGNYYAVWKNNDQIVVTSGLDLTTLETVDKISTHGYSWDATNKILAINDLTLDVVDLVDVEDNKYCIYSSNTFSIIIASDSDNKITSSISGAIAIGGDVSISYSDTIGRLTIETSTGIVATNIVSLIGGNINLNCTTGSAIIVDNEENDAEVVIGSQRNMQTINLYVTSNASKVITADVVSVYGADAVLEANAPWGYAVYCSGLCVGFESTASLRSGTTSPCVYAKNVLVTHYSFLEAVSTSNAAIVTENKITLDTYRGVIKAGADKQNATFVSEYTNEKYVIIKYHKFNFAQSADGKTYTATCENEDCCLENNKIEMSLSISNKVYDGNAISFDVLNKDAFLNETGVEYFGAAFEGVYGTEYTATSTAPTDAGKYKISIKARVFTINRSVILSAEFEIYKADSSITSVPTIKDNLIFNGEAQELINAGTASGGTLNYKLEGGEYSAAIPTATNVGEYKVYYKVVGDANHNDTEEGFVTVVISPKRVEIDWCENNFVYNGSVQIITATYKDVSNQDVALSVSVDKEFKYVGDYVATAAFANSETNYVLEPINSAQYNIARLKIAKPEANTSSFVYTGSEITYSLTTNSYYTISGNKQTNVGSYEVIVILVDTANTEWSDSTTVALTYSFDIAKADAVLTIAPTAKTLVFNGSAQTLVNAGETEHGTIYYKLSGGEYATSLPNGTNAASYVVYYKVVGDSNHNDIAEVSFNVTISQKVIEINWCENSFTYNGNIQNVTATYRDVSNVKIDLSVSVSSEFRNAGEYTATASFKFNETNYKLPTVVTKVYNIAKFKVAKPQADTRIFAYTGAQQTYQIAVSDYYTISNNIKTEVGMYSVGVTLKDKNNTEWSDSTTVDLTYEFVINQVSFDAAEDDSGNPNTDVKVESINGGVAPNAKLVVETVDVSSATQKARLTEAISLAANKEVLSAIDIKFVLNASEVQPNGKVVVKIKVPTAVGSKSFELYHVHEELGETTAAKLTYSAVDAQGYITVEVENFSEFVFVAEKEVVPPPVAPKETNITPWIIMGILGLFLVLFFIWFYGLKKQKYDIVSKIVISLFEVVAVVLVCLYKGTDLLPYIIVDLVAFVGVDVLYMYNTSKEELKETKQTSTSEEIKA